MIKNNRKIKKILIANRSEIAARILFTCKVLGIKTVAIYSQEDQFALYVYQANHAYSLKGFGPVAYLNQEKIIKIALKAKVDAIHPGYGFLAENSQFAQKVIDAGIIWIGPTPQNIKLMADKIVARNIMQKADVPVIPGHFVSHNNLNSAKEIAQNIGFPLMLKDPLAGGGKAMRKVNNLDELKNALERIKSESTKLTGSNQILLEKYIQKGRHIEIQIVGDGKNFIHLYERECSIQRRHQKIIEETPCNFINKKILEKIYEIAIFTAKTINYQNIGTVEFIVTPDQKFYFLEMNTRLQVEHSVTELTTGIDLVSLQIEIAKSGKLPFAQKEISRQNHAIECRIYSEDPQNNFAPSTGTIQNLQLPAGPFIRHDHDLQENQKITPLFDPMLSKITTWGKNRNIAIKTMIQALEQLNIYGIKTNIKFLKKILNSQEFLKGDIHIQLLNNKNFIKKLLLKNSEPTIALIAAALFTQIPVPAKKANNIKYIPINTNWKNQKWR